MHRSIKFDVLDAHSGYFVTAAIPGFLGKKLGIPSFFSLYCPVTLLPYKLPADGFLVRCLSTRVDNLIAVSDNVKMSLVKAGVNAHKITVIPPSISDEFYDVAASSNKSNFASIDRVVLFVGNTDVAKGFDLFLQAAKSVLEKSQHVKFIIKLHDSKDVVEQLKLFARGRFGNLVEVIGVVDDMANFVMGADIIVAPFRSTEGIADIPLCILEAMALGKPVVASNLEGIREVIEDGKNGLLVDLDEPDDLFNAIMNLLDNPDLRIYLGNNASSSVKGFSVKETSNELNNLYAANMRGLK
jgi:glycosyltransferase involved in cell wall biosynthesis